MCYYYIICVIICDMLYVYYILNTHKPNVKECLIGMTINQNLFDGYGWTDGKYDPRQEGGHLSIPK